MSKKKKKPNIEVIKRRNRLRRRMMGMKNPILYELEFNPNFKKTYEEMKSDFFHALHLRSHVPDWEHLNQEEKDLRNDIYPFCSLEEVEKILSPQTIEDLLLKKRMDSILSNMRIQRVFHKKACYVKDEDWTLDSQFDDDIFNIFKSSINPKFRTLVEPYHCGTLYSDDPNAWCEPTEFGELIIISESLNKFLYYMILGFMPIVDDEKASRIEQKTSSQALLIALRIMLNSEAHDFEIDPRGDVPIDIDLRIKSYVRTCLLFIIGHEFGHIFKGHLDNNHLFEKPYLRFEVKDGGSGQAYSKSQEKEFEADLHAVEILESDMISRDMIFHTAIQVFIYFDLLEHVIKKLNGGGSPENLNSHPASLDRLKRMHAMIEEEWRSSPFEHSFDAHMSFSKILKDSLDDHIENHSEAFTDYGSIYLDQWHSKNLVDRKDY